MDGKYNLTHLDLSTEVGEEEQYFHTHHLCFKICLSKVFAKDKCDFDDSLGGEGNWCEICFYF